jgi:hypothetical protein
VLSEIGEGFVEVGDEVGFTPCLHHQIIDVYLKVTADLPTETLLHAPLVSGPDVSEAEGHFHIAKTPIRSDKRCCLLVRLFQGYFVVPEVGVEEVEEYATRGRDLIDPGERERILRASFVEAGVVDTHPPLAVLLPNHYGVSNPYGMLHLPNESGRQ